MYIVRTRIKQATTFLFFIIDRIIKSSSSLQLESGGHTDILTGVGFILTLAIQSNVMAPAKTSHQSAASLFAAFLVSW